MFENDTWSFSLRTENTDNSEIYALAEVNEEAFLISLNNELVMVNVSSDEIIDIPLVNPYSESISLKQVNNEIFLWVGTNLYKVLLDSTNTINLQLLEEVTVIQQFSKQRNHFWIKNSLNTFHYFGSEKIPEKALYALNIFENIDDIHIDEQNNLWIINNSDEIFKITSTAFENYFTQCEVNLGRIETNEGSPLSPDGFDLSYANNSLKFSLISNSRDSLFSGSFSRINKAEFNSSTLSVNSRSMTS